MPAVYEIPLTPQPQSLTIALAGVTYALTLRYCNVPLGGWLLDLADTHRNPILTGIPLVTGTNLLGQFAYLGLGFGLYVSTDGDPDAVPTFDNLGVQSHLYAVY